MSIQFEEENYSQMPFRRGMGPEVKTGSKFGNWLVKNGLAQNAFAANIIMLVLAVLVFGLSLYFFKYGFGLPVSSTPPVDTALPLPSDI